jgi:hypothetical protein
MVATFVVWGKYPAEFQRRMRVGLCYVLMMTMEEQSGVNQEMSSTSMESSFGYVESRWIRY